jgi:iron complex outermembrane receptor protein
VAVLAWSTPSAAQERPLPDLALEELMRVDIKHVFGASERLQPVTEAPSSVTIVTRDEIARYGYTTLADVLRSVRGFYVTDDRNYSYLGARGFSRPGDYNTRILLLVNGHRVNDNVYEQGSIGAEFGLDVATIERVEVIRGPASSLYGTSAFFGVVNVVTRTGASVDGVVVQLEGGTPANGRARIMAGRRLGNGLDFVLAGAFDRRAGVDQLFFPAFDAPRTNGGIAQNLDGGRFAQFYGQLTSGNLTVTGMFGSRHKDVPTASFGTIFNTQDPKEHTTDRHSFLDARYDRVFGATRVVLRAAYDRDGYNGTYPYESEEPGLPLIVTDGYLGTRLTLDVRATRAIRGRQTVTFGAEFVENPKQNQWLRDTSGESITIDHSSRQIGMFVQDEVKISRWLLINAGGRYDSYRSFSRFTPRGAVIVMPSASQSFKYLYGRAFRAPNEFVLLPAGDAARAGIDRHARARLGTLRRRHVAYVGVGLPVRSVETHHADWHRR